MEGARNPLLFGGDDNQGLLLDHLDGRGLHQVVLLGRELLHLNLRGIVGGSLGQLPVLGRPPPLLLRGAPFLHGGGVPSLGSGHEVLDWRSGLPPAAVVRGLDDALALLVLLR